MDDFLFNLGLNLLESPYAWLVALGPPLVVVAGAVFLASPERNLSPGARAAVIVVAAIVVLTMVPTALAA